MIIGRKTEWMWIRAALSAQRNVLLEGPVGVGKTVLALAVAEEFGSSVFRIDGDGRYSEQKLTGWFDPPLVLQKGYSRETFVPGPLVQAMEAGGILLINELNRLPEGVQNVLLPAIDERKLILPRLGEIQAKKGFQVIATQNPKEFVATSHLSEAILDRFELVVLDYQSEKEEIEIVQKNLKGAPSDLGEKAVQLGRLTREHEQIKRGASVRGAISVSELAAAFMEQKKPLDEAFISGAVMALPNRIEVESTDIRGEMIRPQDLIRELAEAVLKKKS